MYSGYPLRNTIASINIRIGPTIQFRKSDVPSTFVFLNTSPIFSYRTFAKGGYIINISPTASGILVVPEENELMNPDDEGIKYPMPTPRTIAKKIHRVKNLSKKLNFFLSAAGAQLFADIYLRLSLGINNTI
jgi:hypothetical protein